MVFGQRRGSLDERSAVNVEGPSCLDHGCGHNGAPDDLPDVGRGPSLCRLDRASEVLVRGVPESHIASVEAEEASCPTESGGPISTAASTCPGRSAKARSKMSTRLVVSKKVTSTSSSRPSI